MCIEHYPDHYYRQYNYEGQSKSNLYLVIDPKSIKFFKKQIISLKITRSKRFFDITAKQVSTFFISLNEFENALFEKFPFSLLTPAAGGIKLINLT